MCTDSTRDGDAAVFKGRPYTAHSTQNATRILVFASLRSVVVISLELDSKIVARTLSLVRSLTVTRTSQDLIFNNLRILALRAARKNKSLPQEARFRTSKF